MAVAVERMLALELEPQGVETELYLVLALVELLQQIVVVVAGVALLKELPFLAVLEVLVVA